MIKQVDRYIIRQIIPPFLLAFFIALFVLMMQVLWVYIDNIIGKGVTILEILEMIGYMCVSLIPQALPLAILISMVMVFGGLSERYELASMKTAGLSLYRIMRFSVIFGILVSGFSYYCSNNLIPITNLKFMTRLHDISNQKPALSLEEGIYNDDFAGYAIRIRKRDNDGTGLHDILIYDHKNARQGVINIITASKGRMYTTPDEKYLVMKLYDGYQYQELEEQRGKRRDPVIRSKFEQLTKLFDLTQFQLNKTDENRYKSLEKMLSANQLIKGIDSLQESVKSNRRNLSSSLAELLSDTTSRRLPPKIIKGGIAFQRETTDANHSDTIHLNTLDTSVLQILPKSNVKRYVAKAEGIITGKYNNIRSAIFKLERLGKSLSRHYYELHNKYATALMCFIFVLIGAPMGAIIRKGGYGYPLLVSIIFFMVYIVLFTFMRQMAKAQEISPIVASWLPNIIMFPIGLYLTNMANRDAKFSGVKLFFTRIRSLVVRQR